MEKRRVDIRSIPNISIEERVLKYIGESNKMISSERGEVFGGRVSNSTSSKSSASNSGTSRSGETKVRDFRADYSDKRSIRGMLDKRAGMHDATKTISRFGRVNNGTEARGQTKLEIPTAPVPKIDFSFKKNGIGNSDRLRTINKRPEPKLRDREKPNLGIQKATATQRVTLEFEGNAAPNNARKYQEKERKNHGVSEEGDGDLHKRTESLYNKLQALESKAKVMGYNVVGKSESSDSMQHLPAIPASTTATIQAPTSITGTPLAMRSKLEFKSNKDNRLISPVYLGASHRTRDSIQAQVDKKVEINSKIKSKMTKTTTPMANNTFGSNVRGVRDSNHLAHFNNPNSANTLAKGPQKTADPREVKRRGIPKPSVIPSTAPLKPGLVSIDSKNKINGSNNNNNNNEKNTTNTNTGSGPNKSVGVEGRKFANSVSVVKKQVELINQNVPTNTGKPPQYKPELCIKKPFLTRVGSSKHTTGTNNTTGAKKESGINKMLNVVRTKSRQVKAAVLGLGLMGGDHSHNNHSDNSNKKPAVSNDVNISTTRNISITTRNPLVDNKTSNGAKDATEIKNAAIVNSDINETITDKRGAEPDSRSTVNPRIANNIVKKSNDVTENDLTMCITSTNNYTVTADNEHQENELTLLNNNNIKRTSTRASRSKGSKIQKLVDMFDKNSTHNSLVSDKLSETQSRSVKLKESFGAQSICSSQSKMEELVSIHLNRSTGYEMLPDRLSILLPPGNRDDHLYLDSKKSSMLFPIEYDEIKDKGSRESVNTSFYLKKIEELESKISELQKERVKEASDYRMLLESKEDVIFEMEMNIEEKNKQLQSISVELENERLKVKEITSHSNNLSIQLNSMAEEFNTYKKSAQLTPAPLTNFSMNSTVSNNSLETLHSYNSKLTKELNSVKSLLSLKNSEISQLSVENSKKQEEIHSLQDTIYQLKDLITLNSKNFNKYQQQVQSHFVKLQAKANLLSHNRDRLLADLNMYKIMDGHSPHYCGFVEKTNELEDLVERLVSNSRFLITTIEQLTGSPYFFGPLFSKNEDGSVDDFLLSVDLSKLADSRSNSNFIFRPPSPTDSILSSVSSTSYNDCNDSKLSSLSSSNPSLFIHDVHDNEQSVYSNNNISKNSYHSSTNPGFLLY
ncbi:hypothetical protein AX774_g4034 [Zancudomyces culisetae]|uniref:Uncharacterized protein n=1 Tax=Zancudomyces culisetae TaxID=1213189 RepID=A0A1R1PNL4_ZANCU|nr:hypothetical protein AX774_g4034 [Zancudomyces culisetae]|eukprot:OMH82482.1 hypothetical protein AX774_g4034 [Zancudomyces culisetae]